MASQPPWAVASTARHYCPKLQSLAYALLTAVIMTAGAAFVLLGMAMPYGQSMAAAVFAPPLDISRIVLVTIGLGLCMIGLAPLVLALRYEHAATVRSV